MRKEDIFSIPNVLSFARIFLVIPIVYYLSIDENLTTVWFILLAVVMDTLDGIIARTTNRITTLGKILDPLADKINTAGAFIALAIYQDFPVWIAAVIVLRDVVIIIGAAFAYKKRSIVSASNLPGKLTVFIITIFGLSYILKIELLQFPLMILAAIMIIYSIINYAQILIKSDPQ